REDQHAGPGDAVAQGDQRRLAVLAEQRAVQAHGRDEQAGREHGERHEREVGTGLEGVEVAEALLERQREEEPGEDLHAHLHDAQLLEQLDPVAVGALVRRLVTAVRDIVVHRSSLAPSLRQSSSRWGQESAPSCSTLGDPHRWTLLCVTTSPLPTTTSHRRSPTCSPHSARATRSRWASSAWTSRRTRGGGPTRCT